MNRLRILNAAVTSPVSGVHSSRVKKTFCGHSTFSSPIDTPYFSKCLTAKTK